MEEDFGFSLVSETELESIKNQDIIVNETVEEYKSLIEQNFKYKLKEMENEILPLLAGLMKNPEKEYIYWPNRQDVLQTKIEKIKNLTISLMES